MEVDAQGLWRQAVPVVLAAMVLVCGLFLPLTEAMYRPAYIAAIVLALTTPAAFLAVAPKGLLRQSRAYLWLFVATAFSALCCAAVAVGLLSFGSPAGAAGDIGGLPLWMLSTLGLLAATSCAIAARKTAFREPSTLRDFQRQERQERRQRHK